MSEQPVLSGGYTYTFGYDAAGNPTTFKGVGQSFNADNQSTASGYTYDGDGNPISYRGNPLVFDQEDRLLQYGPANSPLLTAGYDAEGRRAWKNSSAGLLYFLYDGDLPVCDIAGNGVTNTYNTFGPNGLVSRHFYGGSGYFYAFDPVGGPAERLNPDATISNSSFFTAWGVRFSTWQSSESYSSFGGQWGGYFDQETGLVLFGSRYYDPTTGRFLTRDPIGYEGGINLYAYCGNNPVNRIDPLGLDDDDDFPVDEQGRARPYRKAIKQINQQIVQPISTVVHMAAELHPLSPIVKAAYGRDNAGKPLSLGARATEGALGIVALIPGGGEAESAAKGISLGFEMDAIALYKKTGAPYFKLWKDFGITRRSIQVGNFGRAFHQAR